MSLGKVCIDCGDGYGNTLFLWLTDELWKELGYKSEDYCCSNCIIRRLNEHCWKGMDKGYFGYFLLGNKKSHDFDTLREKVHIKKNKNAKLRNRNSV